MNSARSFPPPRATTSQSSSICQGTSVRGFEASIWYIHGLSVYRDEFISRCLIGFITLDMSFGCWSQDQVIGQRVIDFFFWFRNHGVGEISWILWKLGIRVIQVYNLGNNSSARRRGESV